MPNAYSTYAETNCLSSLGWYSTIYPATALAATVNGDARYICPGPLLPGKFRFCALMTTWSERVDTPGPALMHAPQLGSMTRAPALSKISRYPLLFEYSRVSCEPNWIQNSTPGATRFPCFSASARTAAYISMSSFFPAVQVPP